MSAIVQVVDLVKRYPAQGLFGSRRGAAAVRAVDGVSFEIQRGETFAVVGESGCGKSTLARLLLRIIEPTSGSVRFDGRDLQKTSGAEMRALRRHMQMVFQDPYGSLNPRMTVAQMLSEPLALHAVVPAGQRASRVRELLSLVGLRGDVAQRYPHEFSGGQRQRIAIARALAAEPQLIVCDEPVSALDVSIRAQILNLLADLQSRLGLTYLFISHDLAVVRHLATRVAVMYLGRLVESAPSEQLFRQPRHPYTRALLAAVPRPVPGAKARAAVLVGDVPSPMAPPPGCHFHTRCPHGVERCRIEVPANEPVPGGGSVACHRWRELQVNTNGAPLVRIDNPILSRLQQAFERPI